jgi:acetate kinase
MSDESGMPVLALNAGSSSLKFGLYLVAANTRRMLVSGMIEVADDHGAFNAHDADGNALACDASPLGTPRAAIARIVEFLAANDLPSPLAIGHRIVHGGPICRRHTLIDATVMRQLEAAKVFAPLHVPTALSLVRCTQERFPHVPQAACLDTTFHADLPAVARTLPIPRDLRALGIERYGFHGLSCESIVRQLGVHVPPRLLIAHLGHGASVTAIADGRSIDTSMGLTPSGGVIMSTRCGDIDPGVLAYAVRELRYDAARLEALIDQRSGLQGISGISGDMRNLREAATSNADARLAIAMFCYSVRKQIGAMAAALGGIDLLVFTGGIGENDATTRASICEGLDGLGIGTESKSLEPESELPKHTSASALDRQQPVCAVRVLPSQEDAQIAWHTWRLTTQQGREQVVAQRFSA